MKTEFRARRVDTGVLRATVFIIAAVLADSAAAQVAPDPAMYAFSAASRVRCLDGEARQIMALALAASPTVARQVAELQSTDLIVGIETHARQSRIRGEARIIAATPEARLLRIRITIPGGRHELISVLGHELQHALEIAADPGVRDAATLRAYYLRIGYERVNGGYYETEMALEVTRRVAAEIVAWKPPYAPDNR